MTCEYCGCDCCEEPEWDGVPVVPPAAGTVERLMYDYFAPKIAAEVERSEQTWKRFEK